MKFGGAALRLASSPLCGPETHNLVLGGISKEDLTLVLGGISKEDLTNVTFCNK
ncbi:MAG: hypothetical protein HY537_08290 [Deltaproteobacteria bacterium]|nr:hypothetical protein [Deltaproteobacteria bacterium]